MLPRLRLKPGAKGPRALADRARDRGDWAEAARHYRDALAATPERAPIWVQYGHALKESGDIAAAEAAYRQALALDATVADTHLQLGHALKLQGRNEAAAVSYLRALALDTALSDAARELVRLGWTAAGIDSGTLARLQRVRRRQEAGSGAPAPAPGRSLHSIVFDVSDLLRFFSWGRLPTGIPRLQIQIISSLLREPARDCELTVACLLPAADFWVPLPADAFLELADLALAGGEVDDPLWRGLLAEVNAGLAAAEPWAFAPGAVLVNIGSSGWCKNYFLMIRRAKANFGILYIPFVHDCIPLVMPEHCTEGVRREYIEWLVGVFYHADGFLVPSRSTAADLTKIARLLRHRIPEPWIIREDAHHFTNGEAPAGGSGIVRRYGLEGRDFVLFVATLEARKNHLLAFDAWLSMIGERGLRRTPMLVCVGQPGWLVDAAMARLRSSELLQQRVLILSNVADAELAALYRGCLFTLYPSLYEGWGLPVTEALCYGKVPLTTRVSSLPEAGGDFAEYFDHRSQRDLIAKVERLIDDRAYRAEREARIRAEFRPRRWVDLAGEIVAQVLSQTPAPRASLGDDDGIWPQPAVSGRYYPLAHNLEPSLYPGIVAGEMFRMGSGWWDPEDWGTWVKHETADIAFRLGEAEDCGYLIYLGLRGIAANACDYEIGVVGEAGTLCGRLAPHEDRWIMLALASPAARDGVVHIRLRTTGKADLAALTNGSDPRTITIGVLGFYLCRADDLAARHRFVEAHQLHCLGDLNGGGESPIDLALAAG